MSIHLLQELSHSHLPALLREPAQIDEVRILRAAGLVMAFVPAPTELDQVPGQPTAAQVLAITPKGHEELQRLEATQRADASRPAPGAARWH